MTFGKISTGALSDLEKVTKQAYAMVSVYGLNKRIGNRSFYDPRAEATFTKPYSEETARVIDEEAGAIIERAYAKAREILEMHQDKLTALAERLLDREVLFKEDLVELLGARPWDPRPSMPFREEAVEPPKPRQEADNDRLSLRLPSRRTPQKNRMRMRLRMDADRADENAA